MMQGERKERIPAAKAIANNDVVNKSPYSLF